MDHMVYVDAKEKDLEKLIAGTKQMIIRGREGSRPTNPSAGAAIVRAHSTHIFGKLSVHNRTEAVARARELGLL
jgi:hypothetical protein